MATKTSGTAQLLVLDGAVNDIEGSIDGLRYGDIRWDKQAENAIIHTSFALIIRMSPLTRTRFHSGKVVSLPVSTKVIVFPSTSVG